MNTNIHEQISLTSKIELLLSIMTKMSKLELTLVMKKQLFIRFEVRFLMNVKRSGPVRPCVFVSCNDLKEMSYRHTCRFGSDFGNQKKKNGDRNCN